MIERKFVAARLNEFQIQEYIGEALRGVGHSHIKFQKTPLGEKIIIEILEADEKSKGGIVLPDTAKEKPQQGKVIAIGTGRTLANGKLVPPSVKPGDRIIFGKYSGNEVEVEQGEYLIVNEEDILAIVK